MLRVRANERNAPGSVCFFQRDLLDLALIENHGVGVEGVLTHRVYVVCQRQHHWMLRVRGSGGQVDAGTGQFVQAIEYQTAAHDGIHVEGRMAANGVIQGLGIGVFDRPLYADMIFCKSVGDQKLEVERVILLCGFCGYQTMRHGLRA